MVSVLAWQTTFVIIKLISTSPAIIQLSSFFILWQWSWFNLHTISFYNLNNSFLNFLCELHLHVCTQLEAPCNQLNFLAENCQLCLIYTKKANLYLHLKVTSEDQEICTITLSIWESVDDPSDNIRKSLDLFTFTALMSQINQWTHSCVRFFNIFGSQKADFIWLRMSMPIVKQSVNWNDWHNWIF